MVYLHRKSILKSVCVAERSTNAADAVRVILVARVSVSVPARGVLPLIRDKEKPHNPHLLSGDQSIRTNRQGIGDKGRYEIVISLLVASSTQLTEQNWIDHVR